MKKYVIALDLDGTLLTDDKIITDVSKNYLNKLTEAGHLICLSTGRPYAGMIKYYNELNLKTPIICSNGGFLCNPSDANFKSVNFGIDKNIIVDITKEKEDCISDAYFSYNDDIYLTSHNDKLKVFIHTSEDSVIHKGKIYDITDVDPSGLILLIKEDKTEEFEKYVNSKYSSTISLRQFYHHEGDYIYELYQKEISKASALKEVLSFYNLSTENLIAIGDGDNDKEMIEYAYVGVAMINGRKELIKNAKYITKTDNNNDGVVLFLDHYLDINYLG